MGPRTAYKKAAPLKQAVCRKRVAGSSPVIGVSVVGSMALAPRLTRGQSELIRAVTQRACRIDGRTRAWGRQAAPSEALIRREQSTCLRRSINRASVREHWENHTSREEAAVTEERGKKGSRKWGMDRWNMLAVLKNKQTRFCVCLQFPPNPNAVDQLRYG